MHAGSASCPYAHLTTREAELVSLIANGLTSAQAAARTGLTEATVAHCLSDAMAKTGSRSRTELVARAFAGGVLSPTWPPHLTDRRCVPDRIVRPALVSRSGPKHVRAG